MRVNEKKKVGEWGVTYASLVSFSFVLIEASV